MALQLILTGEMIGAQEAYRIGLVNEVVTATELIGRAEAILKQIAANAPIRALPRAPLADEGMAEPVIVGPPGLEELAGHVGGPGRALCEVLADALDGPMNGIHGAER